MREMFGFTVTGPVVAWKRAQSFGKQRFTPKSQREYQGLVRACALNERPAGWTLDGRYGIEVDYVPLDKRRRDIDNVAKTIMDSLNGVAWRDDSQVDIVFIKRSKQTGPAPGVYVEVERLVNHA